VIKVNLDWLRAKLDELRPLRDRATSLRDHYEWGVIYATRFSTNDLQNLEDGGGEGLRCFAAIPAKNIVAKVRVHNLTEEIAFQRKSSAERQLIRSGGYFSGLPALVKKMGRKETRTSSLAFFTNRMTTDPEAGVDVSGDIVARLRSNSNGPSRETEWP
jgi:hypothetical protein